jgi:hypothetical protein
MRTLNTSIYDSDDFKKATDVAMRLKKPVHLD